MLNANSICNRFYSYVACDIDKNFCFVVALAGNIHFKLLSAKWHVNQCDDITVV